VQGSEGTALELCRTYDFLTRLCDEFEPLRAQLLAHLQDVGLLRVSSILVARSSISHPTAPMPPASPPVAPSTAHGASADLYYDHCG
jgi:hypothetical protein